MIKTVSNKEVQFLKGRLNLLSVILNLGHEAFAKKNLKDLTYHVMNNSRQVMPYSRCALVELKPKPVVVGVMGQPSVNHTSEYCLQLKAFIKPFYELKEEVEVTIEVLEKARAKDSSVEGWKDLTRNGTKIMLIPFLPPEGDESAETYIWVVEYHEEQSQAASSLVVLGKHYSEALWYILSGRRWTHKGLLSSLKTIFSPGKIFLVFLIVTLLSCLFLQVPISSRADFELVPKHYQIAYAPVSGVISEVLHENGDKVVKGETILRYDAKELRFELSLAEQRLKEITLQKAVAEVDPRQRKDVKLLEVQIQQEKVKIDEIRWRLSKGEIISEQAGVLVMAEREVMLGREVRGGEKLFETVHSEELLAEVMLNETDASVLDDDVTVVMYLHAKPEEPVDNNNTIMAISPKPIITETNQFAYKIKVSFDEEEMGGLVGMRGIARISGREVPLGYYLFRNMILAWREL